MEVKRICPECKTENLEGANFCEHCGTKISEECPRCWKLNGNPGRCPLSKCNYSNKPISLNS
ncbi:zinc ribbon domain-containing protein [Clostridium sp. CX1]|uniref:double zinc ribbon domain-containing protein n=1 Tax=Clostridium sp. CX1 TaxID=2978346 RepID=UPI0021BFAE24|nr:zinc ribbon domain-containing protein [Clostridium sp. CX1]MCT8978687.1 zinc ribbon domain-containing protein [Clostridium sp. CX1]